MNIIEKNATLSFFTFLLKITKNKIINLIRFPNTHNSITKDYIKYMAKLKYKFDGNNFSIKIQHYSFQLLKRKKSFRQNYFRLY